jgi:HD-like signal output (HDOD) protein
VTDLGTHKGRPFIVMEYLGGETLERRLAAKLHLPPEEVVHIGRQIASALGAAHDRGLVHRDLKPANVMLLDHPDYPDFVKVLDFGIAKLLGATTQSLHHQTEVGALLGTPAFMSPEQCLGDLQLDHRSDIYSLGVMLFLMVTGRLPFESEAVGRLILAHVHQAPPRITTFRPELPAELAVVIDRALAKKPQERYADMREFRRALDAAVGRRSLTPVLEVLPAQLTPPPAKTLAPGTPALPQAARAGTPLPAPPRPAPVGQSKLSRAVEVATPRPVPTPPVSLAMGGLSPEELRQRTADALADRVARAAIAYPPLPELANECLDLLADPGYSFATVAALIRKDGRFASHVVRRANSDGAGRGIATNPEQAMGRLGSEWLRVAIVELCARRVIDVREPRFEDIYRRPWLHALGGAVAADRLARQVGAEAKAADAYLAALLRSAGVSLLFPAILEIERELAGRRPPRATPAEVVVELINRHGRSVTAELVRRWGLPEPIAVALEGADTLNPKEGWSLRNLVRTGGALADREGFYLRRENVDEAQATLDASARDLALSELRLRRILDRLKEAIRLRE